MKIINILFVKTYEEIYPPVSDGSMLNEHTAPQEYAADLKRASAESFELV